MHRYELVSNADWKTYTESGRVPAEGEQVCVKYNFDNKWYRGFIDEVKQVTDSNYSQIILTDCLAAELHSYQPQLSLCSSSQELLSIPHCKTMLGRHRFSVAAPRVWNSLSLGLKTNCDSLRGFKTGLKTYLFRQDYN